MIVFCAEVMFVICELAMFDAAVSVLMFAPTWPRWKATALMALSMVCRAASELAWLDRLVPVRLVPAPAPDSTPPVPVTPPTVAVTCVPMSEVALAAAEVPTLASVRLPTVTL